MIRFMNFLFFGILNLMLIINTSSSAEASCNLVLGNPPATLIELEVSLQIPLTELARLRIQIDQMKGKTDAVSISMVEWLESNFQAKRSEIINYILKTDFMTEDQWDQKMRNEVALIQNVKVENAAQPEVERSPKKSFEWRKLGTQARFNQVPYGKIPQVPSAESSEIWPFELMDSLVSQYIWQRVGELAQEYLNKKDLAYPLQPSKVQHSPLNPVESVTYEEINAWIKDLNALSQADISELHEIFPDHEEGDHFYLPSPGELTWTILWTTGINTYRPLTEADRENLSKLGGIASLVNARASTPKIGAIEEPIMSPLESPFWHLFGDVSAIASDLYILQSDGVNKIRVIGGSLLSDQLNIMVPEHTRSPHAGFRLKRVR